jgi:hypothetical protein
MPVASAGQGGSAERRFQKSKSQIPNPKKKGAPPSCCNRFRRPGRFRRRNRSRFLADVTWKRSGHWRGRPPGRTGRGGFRGDGRYGKHGRDGRNGRYGTDGRDGVLRGRGGRRLSGFPLRPERRNRRGADGMEAVPPKGPSQGPGLPGGRVLPRSISSPACFPARFSIRFSRLFPRAFPVRFFFRRFSRILRLRRRARCLFLACIT